MPIIDSSVSFNEHVTKTVSDCLHRLIRINRIKHLLDRKTLLSLINAFVFSKLFYVLFLRMEQYIQNKCKKTTVGSELCREDSPRPQKV